jgi:ornithine decarboxylase
MARKGPGTEHPMTTARILDFIRTRRPDGPCLVVDLDVVRDNFQSFRKALPDSSIFYAVKANPAPEILRLLANLGSNFDCASVAEIEMAMKAGATADRVSYGNTIKKERDIARAHALGVSLFAVDSHEEVEKIARAAPGARVFCRVLTDGEGAEWPLSRKFGCVPQMAVDVLVYAHQLGLVSHGVSFHVGSQMTKLDAWDSALGDARASSTSWPSRVSSSRWSTWAAVFRPAISRTSRPRRPMARRSSPRCASISATSIPETIIEPGRGMVGNAGAIKAEVVLVSRKSDEDDVRWVFLDIGKFGGLAETMDEAIRYSIVTPRDGDAMEPCVLAGPTCDSADVLYEKTPYPMPVSLTIGDEVLIEGTGAYTTTYSAVAFNGFEPLRSYVI